MLVNYIKCRVAIKPSWFRKGSTFFVELKRERIEPFNRYFLYVS